MVDDMFNLQSGILSIAVSCQILMLDFQFFTCIIGQYILFWLKLFCQSKQSYFEQILHEDQSIIILLLVLLLSLSVLILRNWSWPAMTYGNIHLVFDLVVLSTIIILVEAIVWTNTNAYAHFTILSIFQIVNDAGVTNQLTKRIASAFGHLALQSLFATNQ